MSKEDLETLVKLFGDPIGIVQLGVRMMKEKTREDIMGRKLGDILSSSTILNLKDRMRGGPLGLRLLPQIFGPNDKSSKEIEKKTVKEETKKSEPEPAAEKHEDEKKAQNKVESSS
jgi:hypothetical protein